MTSLPAGKIIYFIEDLFKNRNGKSFQTQNCQLSLTLIDLIVAKYINKWSGKHSLSVVT